MPVDVGTVMMEFTLQVHGRLGGGTVIVARGELDYAATDRFRACVERAVQPPPGVLFIDLHLVTFIDSSGMGALVFAQKVAARAGARLVLENPSEIVLRTLRTAGLLGFFHLPST